MRHDGDGDIVRSTGGSNKLLNGQFWLGWHLTSLYETLPVGR